MNQEEILRELQNNPNLSDPWISAVMAAIKDGLIEYNENLTMYTADQIAEYANIKSHMDILSDDDFSKLTNPNLNSSQMKIALVSLINKIPSDIVWKIVAEDIPYSISNYVSQAYLEGFDMTKYVHGYTVDQVYQIYAGLKTGVDVTKYDYDTIPAEIMEFIRHALILGLDARYDFEKDKVTLE